MAQLKSMVLKKVDAKMIPKLDSALTTYHDMIERELNVSVKDIPGAAGGLGAGILAFFNASLSNGIDIVLKETDFSRRVQDADLVVTGEGKMDAQTVFGKTPIGVAKAKRTSRSCYSYLW